jgi:hypothetical protein
MRKGVVAAACLALAVPVGVLLVSHGTGSAGSGCSVRYTAAAGRLRLTVTLEQPGSVEVRAGGGTVTRAESAGASTIELPGTSAPSVTEFTADGQLLACSVVPGG